MHAKNGNHNSDKLNIGIVGGSIAGCTAAIELHRAGHQVTVFERSPAALKDRGAGMAAPVDTIKQLIERDLIDADMSYFHISEILTLALSLAMRYTAVPLGVSLSR